MNKLNEQEKSTVVTKHKFTGFTIIKLCALHVKYVRDIDPKILFLVVQIMYGKLMNTLLGTGE